MCRQVHAHGLQRQDSNYHEAAIITSGSAMWRSGICQCHVLTGDVAVAQVPTGAWFPLALAAVVMAISCTWHWVAIKRARYHNAHAKQLPALLQPVLEELPSDGACPAQETTGSVDRKSGASPTLYRVSPFSCCPNT